MNTQLAKLKNVVIFLAVIFTALIPLMAHADWSIKGLGTLGGGSSRALGINDFGQVVGGSGYEHAFITGSDGIGMTDLGTLGGRASGAASINNSGQVVGASDTTSGYEHAFITGSNGIGMTDLGTLGGNYSQAAGINDSGQVVGESSTASGSVHAFITGSNGVGMTDLGTLGGGDYSQASDINNFGQVVGISFATSGYLQAFITGPNGTGMTDLGTLDGARSIDVVTLSFASSINDSAQVAGGSYTASGSFHAYITGPNGIGMTDLGTLGGNYSRAAGINDSGEVVGVMETAHGEYHSFIFSHGGITDLSLLVPVIAAGWTNLNAFSINNNRQITGSGNHNGHEEAFLLSYTPDTVFDPKPIYIPLAVPEPGTYLMLLGGLGLIVYFARRRKEIAI